MEFLVTCIQEPDGRTAVEEAPKKVKGSNGIVQRAVHEIEGRVRVLLLSVSGEDEQRNKCQGEDRGVCISLCCILIP
eukprot:7748062-Karenia_brevis.AAC.1